MRRFEVSKSLGLVAFGGLAVVAALGWSARPSASADPVRAQSFELVDANGRLRGRWGLDDEAASLDLLDVGGNVKLRLKVTDQPQVILFGDDGRRAMRISYDPKEGTYLLLMDQTGRQRVTLCAEDSTSTVQVRDAKQKVRAEAWTDGTTGGKGMLTILSDTGEELWRAPTDETADPK